MQSTRLLPLRLRHARRATCLNVQRRANTRTSGVQQASSRDSPGLKKPSDDKPSIPSQNDTGPETSVHTSDRPHRLRRKLRGGQRREYGLEQESQDGNAPSESTARPFRIRRYVARAGDDVTSVPQAEGRLIREGSLQSTSILTGREANGAGEAFTDQDEWGWRVNGSWTLPSTGDPTENTPPSSLGQGSESRGSEIPNSGVLSESRLLHLGYSAINELRRQDADPLRAEGERSDLTGDAWRHSFYRPDKEAGLPLAKHPRRVRQVIRALEELAARNKKAIESMVPPGESGEAIVEGLTMSEIEQQATEPLLPKIRDVFKPRVNGTLGATTRHSTKMSAGTAVQNDNETAAAKLRADGSLPGLLSEITSTIISEVRNRIWHDLQSLGLSPGFGTASQDQPDVQRNVVTEPRAEPGHPLEQPDRARQLGLTGTSHSSSPPSLPWESSEKARGGQKVHKNSLGARIPSFASPSNTKLTFQHGLGPTQPHQPSARSSHKEPPVGRTAGPNTMSQLSRPKTVSLVDELFPDKPTQPNETSDNTGSVPRLQIEDKRPSGCHKDTKTKSASELREEASKQHLAYEELGREPTVLLFRNASTSLVEEDFRRLIPKGKHIQEWQNNGQYVKVIPGRNLDTCQRLNHYYIIFPSYASAQQYQRNAKRAHAAAQKHTQSSFMSAIPPPAGHFGKGGDADALKKAFSLLPVSQDLQLNIMMPPYGPRLKLMMVSGELPRLAEVKHEHRVLLMIEGTEQDAADVQRYVYLLGRERGLVYDLVEADDAIKRLPTKRKEPYAEVEAEESDTAEPGYMIDQSGEESSSQSWIISFLNGAEAKRFARASQGRMFPVFSAGSASHRPGKMTAEYLW